ncbi:MULTISPECIES: hypothetical protein [unclassified Ruminococcus]|uniref:hypothetical protein n=1 Tax=unclassified Ruminococcus TaxID=2608920 RepID=UPI002109D9F4|nr:MULTISPECIES: hypothetical protein [unclassified Ruminococcus]MCQ4021582.1 hypothetical protein [Ruminococcus sp. zg-924]MCQ4114027.1 hypothetical protein [Ruminococcus sp. zg-921]
MKTRLKAMIAVMLIVLTAGVFIVQSYASGNLNLGAADNKETEYSDEYSTGYIDTAVTKTASGRFQNDKLAGTQKKLELDGQMITLKYDYSYNDNEIAVDKRADVYGSEDIFIDENGTAYHYLYDTDKFLGFTNPSTNLDKIKGSIKVNKETAVDVAADYLSSFVENFEDYVYTETVEQDVGGVGVYDVRFYYYLNGVKTDDVARAWITPNGGVFSAYCFNMGKYSRYQGKSLQMRSDDNAAYADLSDTNNSGTSVQAYLQAAKKHNIDDSYITTTDDGQLMLYTFSCDGTPERHKEEMLPIDVK